MEIRNINNDRPSEVRIVDLREVSAQEFFFLFHKKPLGKIRMNEKFSLYLEYGENVGDSTPW